MIDKSIVANYLEITGQKQLSSKYQVVEISEVYPIERVRKLENGGDK